MNGSLTNLLAYKFLQAGPHLVAGLTNTPIFRIGRLETRA